MRNPFGKLLHYYDICESDMKITPADNLRNIIIDKLLTISNMDYLTALHQLIEKSSATGNQIKLSQEQIALLQLSDKDIENNRLIPQDQIDKGDLEWIKEL